MIIRYEDGSMARAVIYRLVGSNVRTAVEGIENPVDFKLIRGHWISESGAAVTFEFPIEIGMEFLRTLTDLDLSEGHGHCAMGGDWVIRRIANSDNNANSASSAAPN